MWNLPWKGWKEVFVGWPGFGWSLNNGIPNDLPVNVAWANLSGNFWGKSFGHYREHRKNMYSYATTLFVIWSHDTPDEFSFCHQIVCHVYLVFNILTKFFSRNLVAYCLIKFSFEDTIIVWYTDKHNNKLLKFICFFVKRFFMFIHVENLIKSLKCTYCTKFLY